jgi:hypothetical protein
MRFGREPALEARVLDEEGVYLNGTKGSEKKP